MAEKKKPNIVVIWGDDIGITNLSCYSDGLMGYRTPNIDRIAKEGMRFTDSYGEQSCTAGRSSFITGQSVYRTGLSKVGLPGADLGLSPEDPTIATLLKAHGYLTGKEEKSPRKGFVYFSDDGDVMALRFDNWKLVFLEQKLSGTLALWANPFTVLRAPKLFNLRTDPFERADITSNTYFDWSFSHMYLVITGQAIVGEFLKTFAEFPPRQKAASFTLDKVMAQLESAIGA